MLLVRIAGSAGREGVAFRELEVAAADAVVVVVAVNDRKLLPEPALDDSALRNWPDEEDDEPDEPVGDETGDGRRRRPSASDDGAEGGTGRAADVARDGVEPVGGEGGIVRGEEGEA